MQIGVASTSDLVAISAITVPAAAALSGVWIKGNLDRRAEHRSARRVAYADFIASSRVLAARSFRYRFDQTFRGILASSVRDSGPLLLGVLVLRLRALRRSLSETERAGLLGLLGKSALSLNSENESRLYDGLEDLLRANASLRIVGSESIIEASDDVLDVSRRMVDSSASAPTFVTKKIRAELLELKAEFDAAHNNLLSIARKEIPGL
jgi:hypothetical protein